MTYQDDMAGFLVPSEFQVVFWSLFFVAFLVASIKVYCAYSRFIVSWNLVMLILWNLATGVVASYHFVKVFKGKAGAVWMGHVYWKSNNIMLIFLYATLFRLRKIVIYMDP